MDTYSSHAPEELVPGAIFDTLDLRVYTTPGSDWEANGHGWTEATVSQIYGGAPLSWANLLDLSFTLEVYNQSTGRRLIEDQDYTVDWVNHTDTVLQNEALGQFVLIQAFGLGGGNQIYKDDFVGEDSNTHVMNIDYNLINSMVVFQDGREITDYTYAPRYGTTGISTPFSSVEGVVLTVNSTIGVTVGALVTNLGYTSGQTVLDIVDGTSVVTSAAPDSQPSGDIVFLPYTFTTLITFGSNIPVTSRVSLAALATGDPVTYSWSHRKLSSG